MLDDYEKREKENAEKLAATVSQFYPAKVIKDDEGRADYRVILSYKELEFWIRKDWKDFLTISLYPYKYYKNVDGHKAGEIRKSVFISHNMKVLTLKKLNEKLEEEIKNDILMTDFAKDIAEKQAEFLAIVGKIPGIKYHKDYEQKEITGGYIEKNGLEYSFELQHNGYIRQDIRLTANNNLANFLALSDNKYKEPKD